MTAGEIREYFQRSEGAEPVGDRVDEGEVRVRGEE